MKLKIKVFNRDFYLSDVGYIWGGRFLKRHLKKAKNHYSRRTDKPEHIKAQLKENGE